MTENEIKGKGIIHFDKNSNSQLELLFEYKKQNNVFLDLEISQFLLLNIDSINGNEKLENLLFLFSSQSVLNIGIIDNLDFIISKIGKENRELAYTFFLNWMKESDCDKNTNFSNLWENYFSSLKVDNRALQKIITTCVMADDIKFHFLLEQLVAKLYQGANFCLDKEEINDLSLKDIKYYLAKLIGYISFPEPLFNLTFSLIELSQNNHEILNFIFETMDYYHIFEYPYIAKTFFENKLLNENESGEIKSLCKKIIDRANYYLTSEQKKSEITPFLPPKEFITIHRYAEKIKVQDISMNINKKSVFSSFKSTSVLFGKGWNIFIDGKPLGESCFQKLEITYPVPKSSVTNNVELSKFRFICRRLRRDM